MKYVPGHGFVAEQSVFLFFREMFRFGAVSSEVILSSILVAGSLAAAAVYIYSTTPPKKRKMMSSGVPGLANLGNTCYANALLQGLSSVPCVVQWLKDIDTDSTEFLAELKDIILKLNRNDEDNYYDAGRIVSSLYSRGWHIGIGVEHDLHELFNVFLSTGDEELRTIRRSFLTETSLHDLFSGEESPSTPLRQLAFERCAETVKMDAKLRAPFFGLTATQLRCCDTSCGFKKLRYDQCSVISVQIPKVSSHRVTLEHLLRKYFCMEVIRGACCDQCKEKSGKLDSGLFKKQGFSKLPQCLVVRIERGAVMPSGAIFKISDFVEFGETLDVRDLCYYRNKEAEYNDMMSRNKEADSRLPEITSRIVGGAENRDPPLINSSQLDTVGFAANGVCTIDGGTFVNERKEAARYRYQLRAVSEHRGIPETGHFVTYRRGIKDPNAWYLTNDDQVTKVPYSQVANCEAYMLYYQRILPDRWHKIPTFSTVPNLSLQ